jgi:hypothetical protein
MQQSAVLSELSHTAGGGDTLAWSSGRTMTERWKLSELEQNLLQRYIMLHESHNKDWTRGYTRSSQRLTIWAMQGHKRYNY